MNETIAPRALTHRRMPRTAPRGRPLDSDAFSFIDSVLKDDDLSADRLIENLHVIQDHLGCIPATHRRALAAWMNLPMAQIEEVATFYAHFDCVETLAERPAPITIRVCSSLPCQMAGAEALRLALAQGSDLKKVRIIEAPCMGGCGEAPAVMVGQNRVAHATAQKVAAAITTNATTPLIPPYLDFATYRKEGGYTIVTQLRSETRKADDVIAALSHSHLRGLGGAGFPAGRKWTTVRAQPAPRLMTINADEGEPGTFKDRFWLESNPHLMLEGALIAAHCVGVEKIYLYLRDEYPALRTILIREIAALETANLISPGFITMRRGAGAYVCGEESAMIESIEGKRGYPRQRPPIIAEAGLFARPTLNHNVETLCWLRTIIERGPDWFSAHGLNGAKGLRSWSVSGRVKQPGVYITPAGITAHQLISLAGGMADGHTLKAFLPGGASGGILPASLADRPLDFGILADLGAFVGSHAVIVLSQQDSIRDAVRNLVAFFAEESCGQCTPCRVGTEKMDDLLATQTWDIALLNELSAVMADASICGLGQAAPNPLLTALRFFPDEVGA
ncbi:MAG: NADH-quinone oxidoreductase subunit F [Beijerinckiaceae bacterium]|nr:NADH-quinone oxidoreductase subunit F [Beijerinckiaceae bacterium]